MLRLILGEVGSGKTGLLDRMIAYGGIALFLGILLTILMYKLLNNVIRYFSEMMYLLRYRTCLPT